MIVGISSGWIQKQMKSQAQRTEWKQKGEVSGELMVNKNLQDFPIDVLQRDIVKLNTKILQLKSKTKSSIMEIMRTTM